MISSTLKVIGWLFVVCLVLHAQNPAEKVRTSSISGKVTHKGNGVAGIYVGARMSRSGSQPAALTATTDEQGNYKIQNVAPGQYEVTLGARLYVPAGIDRMKRLIVREGETIENVDFSVVRSGVITGKITDAEGRPLIEQPVDVFGGEGPNTGPMLHTFMTNLTDDRGIYRIFGLPPGKYRVAAGTPEEQMLSGLGRGNSFYTQTFFPSTNDRAKATLIEVTEGSEATNVDITLRRTAGAFTVTARLVDADTGKPIAGARYGVEKFRENGSFATSGPITNRLGEIRFENLTPGKYALFLDSEPSAELYAEPVRFEVVDQDIKDLVLKASSGSSVSGVVVIEGREEKTLRNKDSGFVIFAHVIEPDADTHGMSNSTTPTGPVAADGSFSLRGLRPGVVHFSIYTQRGGNTNHFGDARVERDGVFQPNLEIKAREQITGLRLTVRSRSGRIRGLLKFENGQAPMSRAYIYARKIGEENYENPMQIDDRGRFESEALPAGVYEVRVLVYVGRGRPAQKMQQVVVVDNQVSEVNLTVDLKSDAGQEKP